MKATRISQVLIAAALALMSLAVFRPAGGYPFLIYDDGVYVAQEPMVNQGLRPAALLWMLTQPHEVNWHPLTTFTHMSMCQFFGVDPHPHHALNLIVHAANSVLCFLAFRKLTRQPWPSAFVAAVFALHPLRVESVAWIAQLKDLLCGFFWFLALLAYARYAERKTRGRYALVAAALVAALLSKPMAATLPFTLLLLDFWPLKRWPAESWMALTREKAWLFLLVAAHGALTVVIQLGGGAGDFAARVPFTARIGNAVVCYPRYVARFFWPSDLAGLYPHPVWWSWIDIFVATAVLAALSVLAWRCVRSAPWVLTGWLWFLVTLLPVIGLIQVGAQSMANRYTYIPALGLALAVAWTAGAVLSRVPHGRWIGALAAGVVLAGLTIASRVTLVPWRDTIELFEHARRAAEHPAKIRYWLGMALSAAHRPEEAIEQFQALIREDPDFLNSYVAQASLLAQLDRPEEATRILRQGLARQPNDYKLWNNLGMQLAAENRLPEAKEALEHAERLAPDAAIVQSNLGNFYTRTGQNEQAGIHCREALRRNPWEPGYYNDLAIILGRLGAWRESRVLIEKGLWINPRHVNLLNNYAFLLDRSGEKAAAKSFRAEAARWKSAAAP